MGRRQSVALVLIGATCMSFAGLCIRHIENADGYQILFYRGIAQGLMVWLVACSTRQIKVLAFPASFDRTDGLIGLLMACAFCFYVFSILNTSVASTLFILSIAPVFAALLAWVFIREKPALIACVAILIALTGVAVMFGAGLDLGRTKGNLFAVVSALTFACMLVIARKSGKKDVLGGNFLGAILASGAMGLYALTRGNGLHVSAFDLTILLVMGAFTIGLGIALVSRAAPNLPAAEVSLLVLLESVLSPVWVWLFVGEHMTALEILGGVLILAAVALLSLITATSKVEAGATNSQ